MAKCPTVLSWSMAMWQLSPPPTSLGHSAVLLIRLTAPSCWKICFLSFSMPCISQNCWNCPPIKHDINMTSNSDSACQSYFYWMYDVCNAIHDLKGSSDPRLHGIDTKFIQIASHVLVSSLANLIHLTLCAMSSNYNIQKNIFIISFPLLVVIPQERYLLISSGRLIWWVILFWTSFIRPICLFQHALLWFSFYCS